MFRTSVCAHILAIALLLLDLTNAWASKGLTPWGGGATPVLRLVDIDGGQHDLKAQRGKVVLVNFWATWCEPCRAEMPSIQRLRDRLTGKPFTVLMVNVDEPDARVRRYLSETGIDLPVLLDRNKTATREWAVRVLPATFLVGPDGRVRYRLIGDMDWNTDQVVSIVNRLLATPRLEDRGTDPKR
ncbi:MAG: TlpA family protein disulfide reductase [Burkholderiales bacterium]